MSLRYVDCPKHLGVIIYDSQSLQTVRDSLPLHAILRFKKIPKIKVFVKLNLEKKALQIKCKQNRIKTNLMMKVCG